MKDFLILGTLNIYESKDLNWSIDYSNLKSKQLCHLNININILFFFILQLSTQTLASCLLTLL